MSDALKTANREWFQAARFGMFIHWGLYSLTARDMWYYSIEQVGQERYERLFQRFNPEDYDPSAWARLAKQAGMRYAVLTTKHHEGFCLWDSRHTDFKVTRTPYGRDLLRPWLEAFRAEGLKVGLYYSLLDWHHPHFTVDYRHPQRQSAVSLNQTRDFSQYVAYLHDQVRELMSDFGPIHIFWPDLSYGPQPGSGLPGKQAADWQALELKAMVEALQPGILVNDRLGIAGEVPGDFATPEQHIPAHGLSGDGPGRMWEACETIGSAWGYYRGDRTLKSVRQLVRHLVTCVSHNGNLLLNVGPTPRGRIQPEFVDRLQAVGQWLSQHSSSVYGAGACPGLEVVWNCPEHHLAFTQRGSDAYLHCFDEYPPDSLVIRTRGVQVDYADFLDDGTEVEFEHMVLDGADCLRMLMPVITPDPYDTVIHFRLSSVGR